LAAITGAMLAHRIEVLAAQVHTLDAEPVDGAPERPGTVVDIFNVRLPPLEDEEDPDALWTPFAADLARVLKGQLAVQELVDRHIRPSSLPRRVVPRVELRVSVDNEISERLTVIDVQAPDRQGVLHAITRTLSELDLSIHLSKVATEAGQVVDIFYVSDRRSGAKVTDEERLTEVRQRILSALSALEQSRGAGAAAGQGGNP
jgi:[protein-PII] uridylyltransferase